MAGGMHGRGHAWQGACMAGGHAWQGVCMAGGMHGMAFLTHTCENITSLRAVKMDKSCQILYNSGKKTNFKEKQMCKAQSA